MFSRDHTARDRVTNHRSHWYFTRAQQLLRWATVWPE